MHWLFLARFIYHLWLYLTQRGWHT